MSSQPLKSVFKSSIWLIAASLISRFSGFLVLPLLARILGPTDLGLYSLLQNTAQTGDVLSRLGADMAMHRNGSQHESMDTKAVGRLFGSGTLLIISAGILIAFLLCLNPNTAAQSFLREPKVEPWLTVIALVVAITAVATPSWLYLMALHAFRIHAIRTSVLSLVGAAITLLLTYLFGFAGAVWSLVIIALLQVGLGWSLSLPILKQKEIHLRFDHFFTECKSILEFGLPFYAGNFLSGFLMLPLLGFASSSGGLEQLGNLRVGQSLSQLISFLPTTVAPVIISSLSANLVADVDSYHKIKSIHLRSLWVLILFIATITCLNVDSIVVLLFGTSFAQAAFLSKITIWLAAINSLAEMLNQYVVSSGKTHITAIVRFAGLAIMVFLSWLTIPTYGVVGLLVAQVVTAFFSFIAYSRTALGDLRESDMRRILYLSWLSPLIILISFSPTFIPSNINLNIYVSFFLSIILGLAILACSVISFDQTERKELVLVLMGKLRTFFRRA